MIQVTKSNWLRIYFGSGWMFFLPYLLVYLVYAFFDLPVHPRLTRLVGLDWIPSLIHVYWLIHAANACAALFALRDLNSSRSGAWRFVPWAALFFFIWIPGPYLEFPADPWEHWTRINDWSAFTTVRSYSGWGKSSYFLLYSIVGTVSPAKQYQTLNLCYSGVSLLLAWQYYRLARALEFGRSAALLVGALQLVLLGNNAFAFHRYYGLASTMMAQIGALAAIRFALEILRPGPRSGESRPRTIIIVTLSLLLLMALNHIQSVGIAILGVGALACWRLWCNRRHRLKFLAIAAVLNFAAFLAVPSASRLREAGWFSAWHGFDLLSVSSPASLNAIEIMGAIGLANFAAGLALVTRNDSAGWLTVFPPIALASPLFAVPLAEMLTGQGDSYLPVFCRMLLSVPAGFAIVRVVNTIISTVSVRRAASRSVLAIASIATLALLPPDRAIRNRLWNSVARPPQDLRFEVTLNSLPERNSALLRLLREHRLVTSPGTGFVFKAAGIRQSIFGDRLITVPTINAPSRWANSADEYVRNHPADPVFAVVNEASGLFTPHSIAALASQHWLPNEVALDCACQIEFRAMILRSSGSPCTDHPGWWVTHPNTDVEPTPTSQPQSR